MTPLAPLMLIGGAAISIPIALHFFYRARHKPLPWAPMKFLKEAIEQTSRRLKFQELILLALRCLAILLLAFALARFGSEKMAAGGTDDPIDAVFVIDTSYSMAAQDGEKTRFERAKDAALDVLKTLPPRSTVQVYASSDRAKRLGGTAPLTPEQAKQVIAGLELSNQSTDFKDGMTQALAAVESGSAPVREVYVFTDMQKSGFDRDFDAVKRNCGAIRDRGGLIFVRCGNPDRTLTNVAVLGVVPSRTIPHTGSAVPFEVTIKNTGSVMVREIKIGLDVDGKSLERDWVRVEKLEAGEEKKVELSGTVDLSGARRVRVHIANESDGLPGDNVFHSVVNVHDKVRVLLVARHARTGENYDTAGDWFVQRAYYPFPYDPTKDKDKERAKDFFIDVQRVQPTEADPTKLIVPTEPDPARRRKVDICYLLNAPARTDDPFVGMPPKFVDGLVEFVRAGGGLVIGCGSGVNPDVYNRVLGPRGLLPLPLGAIQTAKPEKPFLPAAKLAAEKSPLEALRESPYADWVRETRLYRMIEMKDTGPGSEGGRVLLRTTDGAPLVASRTLGDGEVIFFATSLDESWGRMMSDGHLAGPLITFLTAHLVGRKVPGGTLLAGQRLEWAPTVTADRYELLKPLPPGLQSRPKVILGPAQPGPGGRLIVGTDDTDAVGEYTIIPVTDDRQVPGEVTFVVNPDLEETKNLDVISDGELEKSLGFKPTIIPAGADTETLVRERRKQSEITEWLLLALLFFVVVEAVWAWMCGRAW